MENEAKAIRWIKNVKNDAVVTLEHIAKNEPNVSPMLYTGRKEKAETIIRMLEELQQYRKLGTVEECQEARERLRMKKPNTWEMGDNEGNIYDMYDCPNCGKSYEINYEEYKHCPKCGQAMKIEWR